MTGFNNCVGPVFLGLKGCMFGKNNRNKHCLLCVSLCGCGSLLCRYFGGVHQQSVMSGLIFQADLFRFLCPSASGDEINI